MKKNKGFTFIEILLIFAAISILAVVFILTTSPNKKIEILNKDKVSFVF